MITHFVIAAPPPWRGGDHGWWAAESSGHGYGCGEDVLIVGGAEVHPGAVARLRRIARCPGARAQEQVQGPGVGPDWVCSLVCHRELGVVAEEGSGELGRGRHARCGHPLALIERFEVR